MKRVMNRWVRSHWVRTTLVREEAPKEYNATITGPEEAARILQSLIGSKDREHFVALILNARYRVVGIDIVAVGSLDQALVAPREVFKSAVIGSAAALVVGHNHPSGNPEQSAEDVALTRRLVEAGQLLGIRLLDHIIVTDRTWVSLAESKTVAFTT